MKKSIILLSLLTLAFIHGRAQSEVKVSSYGEKISPDNAVEASQVTELLTGKDSLHLKITGTVASVCQKKGCWLTMDAGNGETMMVKFYDYSFFVPMDCAGKKIILEGTAFMNETSVEELRHYAEDAGKSKEEIAEINEGEKQISFEATGVLLYNE